MLSCIGLSAQIKDDVSASGSNTSWKEKHFFHTIGGTLLLDYYIPPAVPRYFVQETNSGLDSILYYNRNWGFNLASVTYDARINLYDINERMSVSFNVPFALGFGTTEPGGVLSFTSPMLVEFNYGMHSTYNNIDRLGFHVGAGMDVLVTPLIRVEHWREIHRTWVVPMVRAGVKAPYKRRNGFVAVQMSLPQKYFDESEQKTFTQRVHFKLVIGMLLNYD